MSNGKHTPRSRKTAEHYLPARKPSGPWMRVHLLRRKMMSRISTRQPCLLTGNGGSHLCLCSRKLGTLLKPLDRFWDLSLLQAQLSSGGYRDVAFLVDTERFLAERFGGSHVLFPLEDGKCLVDERQDVCWRSANKASALAGSDGFRRHLLFLLNLDCFVKVSDRILESLLIQQ